MMLNLIDRLGEWNPQLMRELKGRLKPFNVLIASGISLLGQLVLFLYQLRETPGEQYSLIGPYCKLYKVYENQQTGLYNEQSQIFQQLESFRRLKLPDKVQEMQLQQKTIEKELADFNKYLSNNFCPTDQINMQLWWRDHFEYIFLTLSVVFIFSLLVAGTYSLINNLAQEERSGTLNFIRLSPQSEKSILTGKILGVPILIYLVTGLAVPLHLWSGISAKIAFSHILSFYTVLIASCILFYSAALLYGLISRFFSGFQPWFGSGAVLTFLIMTMQIATYNQDLNNAATWLRFLSPFDMTAYLFRNLFNRSTSSVAEQLQFFYLPLGKSLIGILGLHLLNYGLWNYWIWEALQRRFRNPNARILSKGQTYAFVAYSQVLLWGFTLQGYINNPLTNRITYDLNRQISNNFSIIVSFNLVLLFGLLAILLPHRQAIQDWARYRHQNSSQKSWLSDLIWSEKSPALAAMAINIVMVTTPLIVWFIIAPALNINNSTSINWLINNLGRMKAILGMLMFIALMMICATITQRTLLMKTHKRAFWAIGTVSALVFVPPIVLGMLRVKPYLNTVPWLFSTFPWAAIEHASIPTIFTAFVAELSVLVFLNIRLTRQIRLAGESATKALMVTTEI
ncbi:MAG: ABC transporter permease [Cyanomargarita calcarea GSE-NOS-MK-12-04C]|jgi:hypothetical protein|uniref:ABC transporter permease n=1 Tax=Cyanomargarita calcarea GSE-NOS-MK-12-04C TaxID=2839659 RepID=A0A951UTG7_9CYAN|nr:ABC transporter permease [Cyanomargarita calcarea GSE-NOS-MK-12-04C]